MSSYIESKLNEITSLLHNRSSFYDEQFLKLKYLLEQTSYKYNMHDYLWEDSLKESAEFVKQHLSKAVLFRDMNNIWNYSVHLLNSNKNFQSILKPMAFEFGVFKGESINFFSKALPSYKFYGFDSFEGIKENWFGHHAIKGDMSLSGKMPEVNNNVTLIKGWFDETVPNFIQNLDDDLSSVCFVHVDGDTYEAAYACLFPILPKLRKGTLILFDELYQFPNWKNGEFKALNEITDKFNISFSYIAFTSFRALIQIN